MIELDHVSVTYADAPAPTLIDVTLHIDEGELCLVIGRTGSGKSTLLGTLNGLVPHFTGGTLAGTVRVAGRDTSTHPPRELADVVGYAGQDPMAGFVTDTVEEELAYAMEQLALPPAVMRKRVEETLDLLGLADLRDRPLVKLSGGQQQRVAIGSVMTAHPSVLVLDEPTSALDPASSDDVLAAIHRLVHDLGVTVILAEHRLERVVHLADRVIQVNSHGTVTEALPADLMRTADVAPPVVELGRIAAWAPLPLSVRDARRAAATLRNRLPAVPPTRTPPTSQPAVPALRARGITVQYAATVAVRDVDLTLHAGTVTALMGRNGSGKSSLLWAVQGTGRRHRGSVDVAGQDPAELPPGKAVGLVGLVPQTPADLLYLDTVDAELAQSDRDSADGAVSTRSLLDRIAPGISGGTHPRDLSEGQQLALVLAIMLRAAPRAMLLDEPTRGLDYPGKQALTNTLQQLARDGHAVLVATHDVEFVAGTAERVIVMADGDIIADGPTAEVVVASPTFAPQVSKILAPLPYLTVDSVVSALAGATA